MLMEKIINAILLDKRYKLMTQMFKALLFVLTYSNFVNQHMCYAIISAKEKEDVGEMVLASVCQELQAKIVLDQKI